MKNTFYLLMLLFIIGGCKEIINEDDISNDMVVIIAPVNDAIITNTNMNFSWQAIEGANEYQLQIAEPNFTNTTQIVLDTIISGLNFTEELSNAHYQFRIKAMNSAYETAFTTHSFSINASADFGNYIVGLQTPLDNAITNQVAQNLTWTAVNGATDYRIQVWQPDTNGALVTDEISISNQKNVTFNEGRFVWQVRAQNATTNTQYSQRNILVDTTAPNIPILQTPTDATTTSAGTITFTWDRVLINGSEEIDSLYIYNDAALTNLFSKEGVTNNTYSINLSANTYYWRMKSFDRAGNESSYSSAFSLILN